MFRLLVHTIVLLICTGVVVETVSETIPCVDVPCSCCNSGECTESSQIKNLCDGCIAGYTGLTCIEPCPANCINCSQLFFESERTCYQCKNGFYNGHYQDFPNQPVQKDCTLSCKTNCKICTSYHNCTQCEDGMYLAEDKACKTCPENCILCLSSSDCSNCKDRYYWTGTFCKLCGPYCKHCQLNSECTVCYRGFYLSDGKCIQCEPGCVSCNEHAECIACQEGYLLEGNKCTPCSKTKRCVNNTCDDKNGVCTIGCVKGYWGNRCEHNCSINCIDGECEEHNGTCTKGCIATYKGSECLCPIYCTCNKQGNCLSCIHGFGEACEKPCGKGCPESKCNRATGECLTDCVHGFTGKNCDKVLQPEVENGPAATVVVFEIAWPLTSVIVMILFPVCICYERRTSRNKGQNTKPSSAKKIWSMDMCFKRRKETKKLEDTCSGKELCRPYTEEPLLMPEQRCSVYIELPPLMSEQIPGGQDVKRVDTLQGVSQQSEEKDV